MKQTFSFIVLVMLLTAKVKANNVQVANVRVSGQTVTGAPATHYSMINFDVSWDNSWRTGTNENNYDGTWMFVKFRKKSSSLWQHATLNYTAPGTAAASGHTQPPGSTITTGADGKGVWLYRATDGVGNVSFTGGSLRWNYGADAVLDGDSVEVRLFALEMVYVPQGAFYLGTGGGETAAFKDGNTASPFLLNTEAQINIANTAGNLSYTGNTGSTALPAAFPKGFNAFWVMKYETSQQQYADFLNNIDQARAANRYSGVFNGIHPNLIAPIPERGYDNANTGDLTAFADWAALRPYTELEYEKAVRGANIMPTPNEYPWGNTTINQQTLITNGGQVNEAAGGNCNYGNVNQFGQPIFAPLRVGVFANDTSNRVKSGAGFYGMMEMAGNTWELVIPIGTSNTDATRSFTKNNGDGNLDANGDANVATWPSSTSNFIGYRGGTHFSPATACRASERNSATAAFTTRGSYGIRVGRSVE